MIRKSRFLLLAILFVTSAVISQTETALFKKLKSFKEVTQITPIKHDSTCLESYELMIIQPVDHNRPNGVKFKQKVYLSHKNESGPVVFVTEGYTAGGNRPNELTRILSANQIVVEHRYFGKSIPQKMDWKYLNIKQAAADHHVIIQLFKKIYTDKWVSTGISKGGQTTLYLKRFYPQDIDAAVPYVAPVNLAQEDPRIFIFLNSVGTKECRDKIISFQRAFLSRRDELIKLLKKDIERDTLKFGLDLDTMYEFWVLEYSFAFWQWGGSNCQEIPAPDAPAEVLFQHMKKANSYDYFTQSSLSEIASFYVQAYNEIGFYNYDLSNFKDLLKVTKDGSNRILVPKGVPIKYDCSVMQDINRWLQKNGNNILYIYGGNDTWSATSIQLTGETNAVKMVKAGGSHGTRIRHFTGSEKELIYSTLEKWLGVTIKRESK